MKKLFCVILVFSSFAYAADRFGNLDKKDQAFYSNDSRDGKNQMERIDSNVRQINQMMGEIQSLKSQVSDLKSEVEALKAAQK